jgi:putative ABC transport system permease protein
VNSYTGLTLKYLKGQKKRSLLTILGIVLSVTLFTAIGTIGVSYRDQLIRHTIQEYGDYHVSFNSIPGEAVPKVAFNASVKSTGVISREGYAVINETSEKEKRENPHAAPYRYLNIKGYDTEAMEMLQVQLESGRLPENPDEIILSSRSLSHFSITPQIGERIKLNLGIRKVASTGEERKINGLGDFGWDLDEIFEAQVQHEFTVVGFMEEVGRGSWSSTFILPAITYNDNKTFDGTKKYFVYAKMKTMDQIKEKTESILSSLRVSNVTEDSAKELYRESGVETFRVEYNNELLKLYGKSTYEGVNKSLILAYTAVAAFIMICTIAVIYNTFHISVVERISQFGMLRCIGATPAQIRSIVMKEAAILSFIGIPVGIFTGTVFMKLLFSYIGFLQLGLLNGMRMIISYPVLVLAGVLGLVSVYFSAIGPARLASRVSPLEAVHKNDASKTDKAARGKQSVLAQKLLGMEGQFAMRNLNRNKKRFRITAFSMVISIVLFIVCNGLIDFLKQTTQLSGSQYSYSLMYDGPSKRIEDSIYEDILKLEAVQHAYKFYNSQVMAVIPKGKLNPRYTELKRQNNGVEEEGGYRTSNNFLSSYGDNSLDALQAKLTTGTINKESMERENGIIVVQKISTITDQGKQLIIDQTTFKVGDKIKIRSMESNKQGYQTVTVAGIAEQYLLSSSPSESAILGFITTPAVYEKIIGNGDFSRIFILAYSDRPHKPVTDYLHALTKYAGGYNYTDRVAELEQAKNDAMIASIFLYGFMGVIALISFLNIVNTVSTNLILRSKEFAVLKAIGMTQSQMSRMIILEGVFYGVIAGVYGAAIGTAVSYGIHRLFMDAVEIVWTVPWSSIGIAFAGAMITTFAATLQPMRRLNKVKIIEALVREN